MGKYQGMGTLANLNGSKSIGFFEKGRKQGAFKEIDKNGAETEIEWYMGKKAKPLIEFKKREARIMMSSRE